MRVDKFEEFQAAVNTLTARFWAKDEPVSKDGKKYSEKAVKIANFMRGRDFAAKAADVKQLVEMILGEEIPLDLSGKTEYVLPQGVLAVLVNNPNSHDYPSTENPTTPVIVDGKVTLVVTPVLTVIQNHGVRADGSLGNSLPNEITSFRAPTESETELFWTLFSAANGVERVDSHTPVKDILASAKKDK